MKVLILATNYPDPNGKIASYYIHTRAMFYIKNNIDVEILNFATDKEYTIDGVKVISLETFKNSKNKEYDILISHAPNLRNHFVFLTKYGKSFKKYLFFFHGHEVLKINKDYSKPFNYMKKKITILQDIYDFIKLKIWRQFFIKNNKKSYYVFVSQWMKEMFIKNTKINEDYIKENSFITYNSIGEEFEKNDYNSDIEKKYDFITIRGNLDGSKYCIDIINELANKNPEYKFLIIGKGKYFTIYDKAKNIEWIDKTCNHEEILDFLNKSKCSLMPTRTDAQGLMACEIATFGIPLITSDIPVCHEIFDSFKNVEFIDNNNIERENIVQKYNEILNKIDNVKNKKYFLDNNCKNEINIIKGICSKI